MNKRTLFIVFIVLSAISFMTAFSMLLIIDTLVSPVMYDGIYLFAGFLFVFFIVYAVAAWSVYREMKKHERLLDSLDAERPVQWPLVKKSYFPIRDNHFYLHIGDYLWREQWLKRDPLYLRRKAIDISGDPEWVAACVNDGLTDQEIIDELLGSSDIQEARKNVLGL